MKGDDKRCVAALRHCYRPRESQSEKLFSATHELLWKARARVQRTLSSSLPHLVSLYVSLSPPAHCVTPIRRR